MKRKLWKGVLGCLLAATLATGGIALTEKPASAYAYSCTGYGWIRVPGTSVASSRWCGETNGSGLNVQSVKGGFTALIAGVYLCDTRLRAQFYNDYGVNYATYYSGINYGCWQAGGVFAVNVNRNMSRGYVRISLLSRGAEQAAVHHTIR